MARTPKLPSGSQAVAATLQAHPEIVRVDVEAHTGHHEDPDASGVLEGWGGDVQLSRERAENTIKMLRALGVTVALNPVAHGATKPVASNLDEGTRALNRRVEFIVSS